MIKTFHVSRVVAGVLVFGSFFFVQYTQAIESDESCGSFITIDAGVQNLDPISDCNFPFGPTNSDPPFQISFSNTQIADGGVYAIAGSSGSLDIPELPHFSFSRLYKHQGSDYLLIASNNEPFTFTAGTYSLYITGGTPLMQTQNIPQKLFAYIVQTAHAQVGMDETTTTTITFTVTDPAPADPVVEEAETEDVVEVVQVESTTASERTSNRYREPEPEPRARVLGMSTTTTTTQGQFERFREIVTIVTILSSREAEMNAQQKALLRSILVEIQEMLKGI